MQALEPGAQGAGAGGDGFGGVGAQAFGDQRGEGGGVGGGDATADQFGRADAQAVQVARDFGDRQADAAGQEPGLAQGLGGGLAAAEGCRFDGELVRGGGAPVGGEDGQAEVGRVPAARARARSIIAFA